MPTQALPLASMAAALAVMVFMATERPIMGVEAPDMAVEPIAVGMQFVVEWTLEHAPAVELVQLFAGPPLAAVEPLVEPSVTGAALVLAAARPVMAATLSAEPPAMAIELYVAPFATVVEPPAAVEFVTGLAVGSVVERALEQALDVERVAVVASGPHASPWDLRGGPGAVRRIHRCCVWPKTSTSRSQIHWPVWSS